MHQPLPPPNPDFFRFCYRLLTVLLLFSPGISTAAQGNQSTETWKIAFLKDQKIGYSYQQRSQVEQNGQQVWRTLQTEQMAFKRFGKEIELRTRQEIYEKADGELISFMLEIQNPPARSRITSGKIVENQLELNLNQAGQNFNTRLPWTRAKSPFFFEHFLRTPNALKSPSYKWTCYVPTLQKEVQFRSTLYPVRTTKLMNGEQKPLRKIQVESFFPTPQRVEKFVDEKGVVLKEIQPLLGQELVLYTTTKEVALQKISGNELDLIVQTQIPTLPIQKLNKLTEATFLIQLENQSLESLFPASDYQQIKVIESDQIELKRLPVKLPNRSTYTAIDPVYLEDSAYLQIKSPEMMTLAIRAANNRLDPALIAPRLAKFVNTFVDEKNFSSAFATAPEVAKSREGDCTEHSILLAALLRAHRIPSKIVAGLVYIPNRSCFIGHMWTEAWLDGKWYPLDAMTANQTIGMTHLKITESDLSNSGPTPEATFAPLMNVMGQAKIALKESKPAQEGSAFQNLQKSLKKKKK